MSDWVGVDMFNLGRDEVVAVEQNIPRGIVRLRQGESSVEVKAETFWAAIGALRDQITIRAAA